MHETHEINCLILAAGKGTRMKSQKAKVLHEIFFAPMIHHVLEAVTPLHLARTLVVVGHQREQVLKTLSDYSIEPVTQTEQKGTGHAVLCAKPHLNKSTTPLLILCGDIPLIRIETLSAMLKNHAHSGSKLTVMTTRLENPANYGRIIRNKNNGFEKIVEEKDATPEERAIQEINAGIYLVDTPFLFKALSMVNTTNKQGEMYLTDIVSIARDHNEVVNTFTCADSLEVLGVNSRLELAQAHRELQQRRNEALMHSGVTLLSPETTYIEKTVTIGIDTCIHPNVLISGNTTIGENCVIRSNAVIHDCTLGEQITIDSFAHLNGKDIPS